MIPGRYAQAAVAKLVFEWAGLVFGVCMYCSMGSYLLHGDVTFNSLWSIGKRIATLSHASGMVRTLPNGVG